MDHQQAVYAWLAELGVPFEVTEHPAAFTIGQMEGLGVTLEGEVLKNLFLQDAKGKRHFLVSLPGGKRADLAALAGQLGSGKLSFASEERLGRLLGLAKGAVTPLGVLNDRDRAVEAVFDRSLAGNPRVGVHPNDNTATVWLAFEDLKRAVEADGRTARFVDL